MVDLVDQMQFLENAEHCENVASEIKTTLNKLDDDHKLQVIRDLILDQIYMLVDKFPQQTQKEMLAIMSNKYLSKWN